MQKPAKGFRLIFGYLGLFTIFESVLTLVPLIMLAFYPQEWQSMLDFIIPAVVSGGIGFGLYQGLIAKREKGRLGTGEDAVLLVLLWISAILIGALPFFLTQFPLLNFGNTEINLGMTFSESFFEATSGFNTTGLSLLPEKAFLDGTISSPNGIDSCSTYGFAHMFLFHRAFMQYIGGVGLVLIVTSVISSKNNFKLYFAEGHNDQIVPNLAKSAKLIFAVYSGWVLFGTIAFWLTGMPPFEAICHSMACLATGGFSTRASSIYWYSLNMPLGQVSNLVYSVNNAIGIEIVSCILMIAGATNFLLHTFFIRGRWKDFFGDIEMKAMAYLLLIGTVLCTLSCLTYYDGGVGNLDFLTSLRYGAYFTVTTLTTSGFTNFPHMLMMGPVCVFVGWILITIGGCMGSTAGGLKLFRVSVLTKEFGWGLKYKDKSTRTLNPHTVRRLGEVKEVEESQVSEARNYLVLVAIFFTLGVLAISFLPAPSDMHNADWFERGFWEFMNAFTSEGINHLDYMAYKIAEPLAYPVLTWIMVFGMFFGRLEILPVIFAGKRLMADPIITWRKNKKKAKAFN